jgi:tryptophan-rich sensory protein
VIAAWNEKTPKGLVLNIGFALAVVFLTNLLILLINPSEMASPPDNYRFEPPGWVIGLVWTFLFAGLGLARWLVAGNGERPIKSSNLVFFLLLFCAAYPLFTLGLHSLVIGLIGNVATCAFALWVASLVRRRSSVATFLVSSVAAWVTFATLLIVEQLRGRSF